MATIASLITPEVWNRYGIQRTTELNAFVRSGVATPLPGLQIPQGGFTVNVPHFGQLTGDAENLSVGTPLTLTRMTSGQQIAVVLTRGRGWTVSDLEAQFTGEDPVRAAMDMIATYWAGQDQKDLLASLAGAFAAASMSGHVHDVSAESTAATRTINPDTLIDATQKLGDAKGSLTAIAMHSATEAYLAKQQMIAYETSANKTDRVPYYLGKRVIIDDSLPVDTGTYTTYLFGAGSVAFTQGGLAGRALEVDRDSVTKEDILTMARTLMIHPVGLKWVGGNQPARAALATGTNWERVFEPKNIPLVAFKHKLA